jgi:hypothetical protein
LAIRQGHWQRASMGENRFDGNYLPTEAYVASNESVNG